MTAVELNAIWFNDALDPSDAMPFRYFGDTFPTSETQGGGVEHDYASGRSRTFSTEQRYTEIDLSLRAVTPEQLAWLNAHKGRVVCFRDPTGRKVFCAYHQVGATTYRLPGRGQDTANIKLESVTLSEAV